MYQLGCHKPDLVNCILTDYNLHKARLFDLREPISGSASLSASFRIRSCPRWKTLSNNSQAALTESAPETRWWRRSSSNCSWRCWMGIVKLFIDDYGIDPNEEVYHGTGKTVLHEAAAQGRDDVIKFLLLRGAEPNPFTTGCTNEFRYTAESQGPHTHCRPTSYPESPLCLAITRNGHHDSRIDNIVKMFVEHGVDPNQPCLRCCGCRPIHIATEYDGRNVVRLLIEKCGVDPESKDLSGRTALHYAASTGNWPMVEQLLHNWRLDPNTASGNGNTPLHDLAAANVCGTLSSSY